MSTNNITNIEIIEMKGGSDNFPVLAEIEVINNPKMNKISRHSLKKLLNYFKLDKRYTILKTTQIYFYYQTKAFHLSR